MSRTSRALLALSGLWLCCACVDRTAGGGEAQGETDTQEPSTDTGAPLPDMGGEPDEDEDEDEDNCEGVDQVELEFELMGTLDGTQNPLSGSDDLACTFTGVEQDQPDELSRAYMFEDCQSLVGGTPWPSYRLWLHTAPSLDPSLDEGTIVRLRYRDDARAWVVTAQPGGLLILAGQTRPELELDVSPLTVEREVRSCPGSSDGCADWLPQRLLFSYDDEALGLVMGESADLGDEVRYRVNVERADQIAGEPSCAGVPDAHYDFVVGLLPE